MAGAPERTWKSSTFSKVGRSSEKSSLSGVTGLCMTPRNLFGMVAALVIVPNPLSQSFVSSPLELRRLAEIRLADDLGKIGSSNRPRMIDLDLAHHLYGLGD